MLYTVLTYVAMLDVGTLFWVEAYLFLYNARHIMYYIKTKAVFVMHIFYIFGAVYERILRYGRSTSNYEFVFVNSLRFLLKGKLYKFRNLNTMLFLFLSNKHKAWKKLMLIFLIFNIWNLSKFIQIFKI